ncbi:MAG: MOSC domain-containing protein [Prolixibacteraceae bacterium]
MMINMLLTGKIEQLEPEGVPSAIQKTASFEREQVIETGLVNDNQADKKHHGGPDKAIHHYASEHYQYWKNIPGITKPEVLYEGRFGENISTVGMDESSVCIGDKYRVGSVVLEVSQARQPCWKLNLRFGHPDMSRMVQDSLRTGWYYRVLEEGRLQAGDAFTLLERNWPEWSLKRLLHVLYLDTQNKKLLEEMTQIAPLAESWKGIALKRLETGRTENWSKRLYNK